MNTYSPEKLESLEQAFNSVCNRDDWKAPIETVIFPADQAIVAEAIAFYTATEAVFIKQGNMLLVKALGYRNGPAGP
jgi:hypothetical protein